MSRIIVLQHVPYEILGTMHALFKQQRVRMKYINFAHHPDARPNLAGYDGLVILGGPMNVDQINEYSHLVTEVELIREAMSLGMPIMGICLGAQLIAKAAGASVKKNFCKEIGWYDVAPTAAGKNDLIIQHFNGIEKIFQWHGDTFDLPPNAVHLAEGKTCSNQAFRLGNNVYGLQFHLEVDEPLIERWLGIPLHIEELSALNGLINPEDIRADTRKYIDTAKQLSNAVFGEFIKLIGHQEVSASFNSR